MVLKTIYVVRHGFRSNWVVNPNTGHYKASIPSPTGISSDPALTSYGVDQAKQLAVKVPSLDPPIDVIFSSPFYRCLQTIAPSVENLLAQGWKDGTVKVENGLGEFFGLARFNHPSPAPLEVLEQHFPWLDNTYQSVIVPAMNGECILALHDRTAYAVHQIITTLDADPTKPETLLISTHAASMIAIGRALTGFMPDIFDEEDFKCYTCSISKFVRRSGQSDQSESIDRANLPRWDPGCPETIPQLDWKRGKGVKGGWDCLLNGDCSFLRGGEERGWRFSIDESFLSDSNSLHSFEKPAVDTTLSEEQSSNSTHGGDSRSGDAPDGHLDKGSRL